MFGATPAARAENPITIGFGMALTGGLAPNGKAALLAMQIWEEEINAKGGLLGRPVKLVYYDDQSNPSTVPGLYTKLLDVDKVDLVVSGYATNMIAPALPVDHAAQPHIPRAARPGGEHRVQLPELFLHHARPAARTRSRASRKGFFEVAMAQNPKPTDARDRRRRRGIPAQRAGRRARNWPRQAGPEDRLRQDLSADAPRTTRRSCARSRRPIRTWCSSPPIRPIPSA